MLLHEEPIYLNNDIIGKTTSGNYSFNYNKNLSFGYIESNLTITDLKGKNLFIEVAKIKYPAVLEIATLKDKSIRLN